MANSLFPLRCHLHNSHLCADCRIREKGPPFDKIRVRLISAQARDTISCKILYSCHLLDGRVVIYDKINRKLKIVDPLRNDARLFCPISGDLHVTGLCCIGPREVAVAFDTNQVQVYNTENMTLKYVIDLEKKAHSMAFYEYLLYESSNTLYKYDLNTKNTQVILPQVFAKEKYTIPVVINSIAVNCSGDRIYVSAEKLGLLCVDKEGQKIFRLTAKDLGMEETWCVTSDDRDNVYVIGSNVGWPRRVVVVNKAGKVDGQIFMSELGIEYPMSLAYSVRHKSLFVGGDLQYIIRYNFNEEK